MEHTPEPDPADILAEALALTAECRPAFLDQACRGSAVLRAELESLLLSHERGRRFFESPLVSPPDPEDLGEDVWSGRTVGSWQLIQRIATGGMGTVYVGARVDREFEKKVAVKLVRSDLQSGEASALFLRERQVLADLDHPNIARILDGGSTPEGVPYLVMEYVDGKPIDLHCDEARLTVSQRLELFLTVCEAVHHAHQNLVIHRDLKPANIMVDRTGLVKLLDFGIAKLIDAGEVEPDFTHTSSRRLTPRYASPEQVQGTRISTATDVYSLGVVLYEVLAGRSPYPASRTPFELEQAVLSQTIERPSQTAASAATPPEIAGRRATTPRKLIQHLAGDLDTIVLRALARDPQRRYPTVQALAADIRRHLAGQPVQARPDTFAYRLSCFVRRNRALATSMVITFAVLVLALFLIASAYRNADRSRQEAEWLAYQNSLAAAESSIRSNAVIEAARQLATAPVRLRGWEWRHLASRLDRSRFRWQAHGGGITYVSYVDGGHRILSASMDRTVRLWSAAGESLSVLGPFDSEVENVAIHERTGRIAVGLNDGSVLLTTPGEEGTPRLLGRGDGWARVSLSADGTRLAAGFFDGSVRLWDVETGRLVRHWTADSGLVIPSFDPLRKRLVTVGVDGVIRVWTPEGRPERTEIPAHSRRIYSMAWSPDGRSLATGSMDRTAAVWNTADWTSRGIFREHQGTVTALAFLDGGESILSAGGDARFLIWHIENGEVVAELRGHAADVSAVAVSADGRTLVSGDWGGMARLWHGPTGDVLSLETHPNRFLVARVSDVEFNESGSRLAAVTNASNCYQWDFESRTGHSWELAGGSEAKFGLSPGVLIATSVSGGLALLREDSGDTLAYVAAHPGREIVLAVDAGSRRAVTGGADSLLKVWSISDLRPVVVIPAGFAIRTLAFSPDRLRLFGAGDGGRIQAWDTRSWALTDSLSAGPSTIVGLAVHPDGVRLATCSLEGEVTRWDLEDRNPSETILQDPAAVYCAALSPDGLRLAVGTGGQLIRIFDFDTKRHLVALHGHTGRISALAWSPDGGSLASAGHDGRVRVWDAPLESR